MLLTDDAKRIEIARNAQERYHRLVFDEEGKKLFCDKIVNIVKN